MANRKVILTANTTDEEIFALSEALGYEEQIMNWEWELVDNPESRVDFIAKHYLQIMEDETKRLSKIYQIKDVDEIVNEKVDGKITLSVE